MTKPEINEKLIDGVAENARINLTDSEKKALLKDFKEILEYFELIQNVKTENAKASFQPIPVKNVLRKDEIKKSLSQEDALKNVKFEENGFIKSPRII